MSSQINDMIWEEIWEEIAQLELSLDNEWSFKLEDVSRETGLHLDDDRDEILNIIAEEMMREREL
jgi:hypothetical protein